MKNPPRKSSPPGYLPGGRQNIEPGRNSVDFTIDDNGIIPVTSGAEKKSGARRAARFLLALGPDQASQILKELDDNEIRQVAQEMTLIDHLTAREKRLILEEFSEMAGDVDEPVRGGRKKAHEILSAGIGEERAHEILERLNRGDLKKDFEFLERIDPPALAAALSAEHPQVAAVALSSINPRIAASVMKNFSPALRSDIALRIAKTSRTHPEAVLRVARVLREKFEKRSDEVYSETGGAETLANILNHMDRNTEDGILNLLGTQAPEVLDTVRGMLYTFEELMQLIPKEMRILLSKVNDDQIVSSALRGAGEEIRRHFFNSLSQNRAADILEEMDRRGPISLREINEARAYIVSVARKLDEDGAIVIKKTKDEWV